MPRGRGRGPARRAARRRAGLGQEPPRPRVRREAAERRRARPLRRLRRGRADAVRAVRRGARPARRGSPTRRAARRARPGGRRAHAAAARPAGPRRRPAARRSRPIPTPSATACTPRSPTCSRRQPAPAAAARARGRALGRRADAAAAAPPRARAPERAPAAARHVPRHRGRRAGRARRRRSPTCAASDDVVRLRLAGLSERRGRRVRPPRRRRRRRRRAGPSWRRRSTSSPTATRSSSASCGAPCVETGARRGRRRRDPADPAAGRDRHARERPRGGQPAALAPRRRARRDLLELAAVAGPGVRARRRPPRGRPRRGRAARGPRGGGPQRHDRGAARARGSPTASPTSSCAGPSTTGSRGCGGPSCTCASARRSRTRRRQSGRALADLAHHFAAAAPLGGARAGRRLQPARGRGGERRRSPSTRPAARLRTALELGIDDRSRSRRRPARARLGQPPGRQVADALEAFAAAAEIARELGDARAAGPGGDRLRGGLLATGHRRRRRASSCSRRRCRARRRDRRAAGRPARRPRAGARLPGEHAARCGRAGRRDRAGPARRRPLRRWRRC